MPQSPIAQYPLYLNNGKPFMKLGELEAAVYWGAIAALGDVPSVKLGAKEGPTKAPNEFDITPERFLELHGVRPELILGYMPFDGQTFTLDLPNGHATFYDNTAEVPLVFTGHTVPLMDDIEIPSVQSHVREHDLLLQVDVGDEFSILPLEILEGLTPIGEQAIYDIVHKTTLVCVPVYEILITLSAEVAVPVRARAVLPNEEWVFRMLGTNGAIGLDLIRHRAATFHWGLNPSARGYANTLFLEDVS